MPNKPLPRQKPTAERASVHPSLRSLVTTQDKSTVEVLQNFVAFSEYMNFTGQSCILMNIILLLYIQLRNSFHSRERGIYEAISLHRPSFQCVLSSVKRQLPSVTDRSYKRQAYSKRVVSIIEFEFRHSGFGLPMLMN